MSLVSKINLLFAVNEGNLQLISSSENAQVLANPKVAQKAGVELQHLVDTLAKSGKALKNPINLSKIDEPISAQLTLSGKDYKMSLTIPGKGTFSILLNEAFTTAIAGAASLTQKPTPPPAQPAKTPSTLKKQTLGIAPINNPDNDCFMNAVFQVLMHDEILRKALRETYQEINSPKAQALCKAMQDYSEGKTISTTDLRVFMPVKFQKGQQDASEFLQMLLNEVSAEKYPDVFVSRKTTYEWEKKHWLWGTVQETVTTTGTAKEFFIDLEIPQSSTMISGQKLIQSHFEKKPHSGNNYKANGTEYTPGKEQIQIEGTPQRLVFLLKRFHTGTKIGTPVDMPEVIQIKDHPYALKKVISHHGGTMTSGHYTSLLQTAEGKWMKANDTTISEVKETKSDRQNGYMYFYEIVS